MLARSFSVGITTASVGTTEMTALPRPVEPSPKTGIQFPIGSRRRSATKFPLSVTSSHNLVENRFAGRRRVLSGYVVLQTSATSRLWCWRTDELERTPALKLLICIFSEDFRPMHQPTFRRNRDRESSIQWGFRYAWVATALRRPLVSSHDCVRGP